MTFIDTNITLEVSLIQFCLKSSINDHIVKSLCREPPGKTFFAVVRSYRLKLEILGGERLLRPGDSVRHGARVACLWACGYILLDSSDVACTKKSYIQSI